MSNSDPVRLEDGAWYFYDECWVDRYGPFETRQQAEDELFVYCVLNEMLPKELPEDDDGIRAWWRKQGGRFHGPKVETGTMPEDQLLPALRKVFGYTNRLAKQCARLVSQTHPRPAGEQLRGRDSEVVTFDEAPGAQAHITRQAEALRKLLAQDFVACEKRFYQYVFKTADSAEVIVDQDEARACGVLDELNAAIERARYPGHSDAANRAGDTFGRTECVEPRDQGLEDA